MSVVNVSSKSKIVRPKIFISDKLPNDSEQAELKTSRGNITVRTARRRLILNRSCIIATDTSAIETVDVRAATRRRRKKSEDHKRGQGKKLTIHNKSSLQKEIVTAPPVRAILHARLCLASGMKLVRTRKTSGKCRKLTSPFAARQAEESIRSGVEPC